MQYNDVSRAGNRMCGCKAMGCIGRVEETRGDVNKDKDQVLVFPLALLWFDASHPSLLSEQRRAILVPAAESAGERIMVVWG
jgi:hypothetical protein